MEPVVSLVILCFRAVKPEIPTDLPEGLTTVCKNFAINHLKINTDELDHLPPIDRARCIGKLCTPGKNHPFHQAIIDKDFSLVKLLATSENLKLVFTQGRTPLHLSANIGSYEITTYFLKFFSKDLKDPSSKTPLHLAAQSHPKIVELLCISGASVNALDKNGSTPLHIAAEVGSSESVQILLKHGAEKNLLNLVGHTPKFLANQRAIEGQKIQSLL